MKWYENLLAKLMMTGIISASLLVFIGGVLYCYHHGHEIAQFQQFHSEPANLISFSMIIRDAFHFSALAMIQLGLYILVMVQVLRVALTVGYFMVLRDRAFIIISLFIFAVLVFSFWR